MAVVLQDGDVIKVTPVIQMVNQVAMSGWHMQQRSHLNAGISDLDVANYFDSLANPAVLQMLCNEAQYRGFMVQKVAPLPVEQSTFSNASAGNGTAGAVGLPGQTSGIIHLKGVTADRHGRGRFYMAFPAVNDNAQAAGTFPHPSQPGLGTYLFKLTNFANTFLVPSNIVVGVDAANIVPVIFDRAHLVAQDVLAKIMEDSWATTRRRGAFGRPNNPPF